MLKAIFIHTLTVGLVLSAATNAGAFERHRATYSGPAKTTIDYSSALKAMSSPGDDCRGTYCGKATTSRLSPTPQEVEGSSDKSPDPHVRLDHCRSTYCGPR